MVGTVAVIFSCGNFSRDNVGLETDEKQIFLCGAVDHSFKLVNLDFVSILAGFCLSLQPKLTGTIGTKCFVWNLLLLLLLCRLVIPDLQNNILMFGWLVIGSPLGRMTLLNKSLKGLSPESEYNGQVALLHTEDRAKMHKKDTRDLSTQFLMASFSQVHSKVNGLLLTSSRKGRSEFRALNETENLMLDLTGYYIFLQNPKDRMFTIITVMQEMLTVWQGSKILLHRIISK